jgi:hypothetical protein
MKLPTPAACLSCERRPVRGRGEYVSRVEVWFGQRLYCKSCAADCEAGLWEPDEEPEE